MPVNRWEFDAVSRIARSQIPQSDAAVTTRRGLVEPAEL